MGVHGLMKQRGVWADATILCRQPLDDWIDEAAAPADGFFAFSPEKGRRLKAFMQFRVYK